MANDNRDEFSERSSESNGFSCFKLLPTLKLYRIERGDFEMIKRRDNSKVFSILICVLLVMLFSSYIVVEAQQNGNTNDTPFSYSGNSKYFYTDPRNKLDDTSCYVFNSQSSTFAINSVYVYGCVLNSLGQVVDEQYCTLWPIQSVPTGEYRYCYNSVYEDGLPYARLELYVNTSAYKYITGLWSPDSY